MILECIQSLTLPPIRYVMTSEYSGGENVLLNTQVGYSKWSWLKSNRQRSKSHGSDEDRRSTSTGPLMILLTKYWCLSHGRALVSASASWSLVAIMQMLLRRWQLRRLYFRTYVVTSADARNTYCHKAGLNRLVDALLGRMHIPDPLLGSGGLQWQVDLPNIWGRHVNLWGDSGSSHSNIIHRNIAYIIIYNHSSIDTYMLVTACSKLPRSVTVIHNRMDQI